MDTVLLSITTVIEQLQARSATIRNEMAARAVTTPEQRTEDLIRIGEIDNMIGQFQIIAHQNDERYSSLTPQLITQRENTPGFFQDSPIRMETEHVLGLFEEVKKRRANYQRDNVSDDTEQRKEVYHFGLEDFFMDLEPHFMTLIGEGRIEISLPYPIYVAGNAVDRVSQRNTVSFVQALVNLNDAVQAAIREDRINN